MKNKRNYIGIALVLITSFAMAQDETPILKTTLNVDSTSELITQGRSSITGVVYARQGTKMSILNMSKKYVAPKGTRVVLLPYTMYFKELIELSKKYDKQGRKLNLAEEVQKCILVTKTTDKKGHFEFKHLMPGQYYVFADFSFLVSGDASYVSSYDDTYVNGQYIGSSPASYGFQHFVYRDGANAKKIVTIDEDGETANIKLKDTRGGY